MGVQNITLRAWWDILPTTPTEAVKRTLEEPVIGGGGVGATTKFISKTVAKGGLRGLLLGGAIGAAGMALLGGGGKQEQDQEATIPVTVTPRQDTTQDQWQQMLRDFQQSARARAAATFRGQQRVTGEGRADISLGQQTFSDIGRDVTYAPTTITGAGAYGGQTQQNILSQALLAHLLQEQQQQATPTQTTTVIPTIEQAQTATKLDSSMLILLAIGAGIFLLGGKN